MIDYYSERVKDYFYSALMLNTDINYKTILELTNRKVIKSYRDLASPDLIKDIVSGEYDLRPETVFKISKLYDSLNDIEKTVIDYMRIGSQNGIEVISCEDSNYPYNWKELSGMPKVIYVRGNIELLGRMAFKGAAAVVGSRDPCKYSIYATDRICRELGERGITVVSGMAYGIDRQAHISSYNTAGGTVAVLAGGADNIYPPVNKDVYDLIRDNGVILSEMPPGQKPLRQYFPSRNRLIAGLSDCTLVMEAGIVSGTLHTASYAANQGKEVFVLPNSIYYENAIGGLKLLEDGGNVLLGSENVIDSITHTLLHKCVLSGCYADIFHNDKKEDFEKQLSIEMIRELAKVKPEAVDDEQWKILIKDALTLKPLCADEICVITMLPFYKVSKLLTELELNGTVCLEKGKYSLTFV